MQLEVRDTSAHQRRWRRLAEQKDATNKQSSRRAERLGSEQMKQCLSLNSACPGTGLFWERTCGTWMSHAMNGRLGNSILDQLLAITVVDPVCGSTPVRNARRTVRDQSCNDGRAKVRGLSRDGLSPHHAPRSPRIRIDLHRFPRLTAIGYDSRQNIANSRNRGRVAR